MKKQLAFLLILIYSFIHSALAQVPKKVVVEHFTNTVCSICASKNPGFYTNYNNQTGVIHLAVHPSAPYSSCILNQHNVPENDARTNYYGVYGSTPRLVIQGVVIPSSANYSSPSLFSPYLGQTSPASIHITQSKFGSDSIRVSVVVKTEAPHSLGNLKLFVALAEDTIFYASPNGETKHFDVFRKSLSGATGITVNLPTTVGDSIVYTMSSPAHFAWNFSRIFSLVILQDAATKAVIQSEAVSPEANINTGISETSNEHSLISVYCSQQTLIVKQEKETNAQLTLMDISGRILLTQSISSTNNTIPLYSIAPGIYVYTIHARDGFLKSGKVVIN